MATRYRKKRIGTSGAASITEEKIEEYISEFLEERDVYGFDGTDFSIKEIQIRPEHSPAEESEKLWKKFQACFSSNETKHHGYLKWFAYKYIEKNLAEIMDFEIGIETNMFLPNLPYWEESPFNAYGRLLGQQEEVLLAWAPYQLNYGPMYWKQEADVSCKSAFIVECGDTSPMSLVLPIITQAVSKVIWLPHKTKGEERKREWDDFETPLKAFIISRVDG